MSPKHLEQYLDSYACSVTWSCPTLCSPMDCNLAGCSVCGLFQARILEWVAISSSRGSSPPRDQIHVSCISFIGQQIFYHCTRIIMTLVLFNFSSTFKKLRNKKTYKRFKVKTIVTFIFCNMLNKYI